VNTSRVTRGVHIIGAGLIGTSLGLALRHAGIPTSLEDANQKALHLAHSLGAGETHALRDPACVVVAVPPATTTEVVLAALQNFPDAVVTDLASVKAPVADTVARSTHAHRYVGSHPMAGREISGAQGAQGDLFRARSWVVCAGAGSPKSVDVVVGIAEAVGADVVHMEAQAHDHAVAYVSHVPQLLSSALASNMEKVSAEHLPLAGAGLRDMTRLASSDAALWKEIAGLNVEDVRAALGDIITTLTRIHDAHDIGPAVEELVAHGAQEVARIPGKHGGGRDMWAEITVIVPDTGGQLLKLLTAIDEANVNIEDLAIEHSPQQPVGLVRVSVQEETAAALVTHLTTQGWNVVEA